MRFKIVLEEVSAILRALLPELRIMNFAVNFVGFQKLVMSAEAYHFTAVKHDNFIGVLY